MSSILVEKADRGYRGLAQFIFSEFCRQCWADRPLVNAGDDWGLETLARTKQSYRPVKMLTKYALTRLHPVRVFLPNTNSPHSENGARAEAILLQQAGEQQASPTHEPASETRAVNSPVVPDAQPLTFRAAELADLPAALALEQQCFTDAYPLSRRQLRRLQQSRSAIFVIAARESDGQLSHVVGSGIALIRRHRSRDAGGPERLSGRIYTLAVDPAERGKGTGRRLLEVLLAELHSRGAARVFLEVAETNGPATALYRCFGFDDLGTLADYYGPGRNAKHMMKPLLPAAVRSEISHYS